MVDTENNLTEAFSKTIEKMAFLSVMPMEKDMVIPEKTILAEISFTGPKSGTLQILTGVDFTKVLAENISAGDETGENACLDALKELANVTCGLLLPLLLISPQDVFDVTVPTVLCGENSPQWNEFTTGQSNCVLNVEGYLVAIRLSYN